MTVGAGAVGFSLLFLPLLLLPQLCVTSGTQGAERCSKGLGPGDHHFDTCIIGAGPGGLQLGQVGGGAMPMQQGGGGDIMMTLQTLQGQDSKGVQTFNTMSQLLRQNGIDQMLSSGGPYTLLAPSDAAFAK